MTNVIFWLASLTIGVATLSASAFGKTLEGWSTDLDKALKKAKEENKSVLIEFTGSDWCPPCIEMRKNVYSKKEFVTAASKNFILVELDFPKGDKELSKKNQPYAAQYNINSFPTMVLLSSEGKEFTRFHDSQFPTTKEMLQHLKEALERKDLD